MMTKLMTWFIELRNRFNELRLSKISMIYVLNWIDDLTSWQDSIQVRILKSSIQAESEFWYWIFKLSHDVDIEYWFEFLTWLVKIWFTTTNIYLIMQ